MALGDRPGHGPRKSALWGLRALGGWGGQGRGQRGSLAAARHLICARQESPPSFLAYFRLRRHEYFIGKPFPPISPGGPELLPVAGAWESARRPEGQQTGQAGARGPGSEASGSSRRGTLPCRAQFGSGGVAGWGTGGQVRGWQGVQVVVMVPPGCPPRPPNTPCDSSHLSMKRPPTEHMLPGECV